jgi:hypothetical protein
MVDFVAYPVAMIPQILVNNYRVAVVVWSRVADPFEAF